MAEKSSRKNKAAKTSETKTAPPSPSTASPPVRQPSGPAEVLGNVVWLMTQSANHKHLFIADLEWLVLPPVMLRQFRLVRSQDKPQAFVTWAMLNDEAEQRMMAGQTRLKPSDWNSGDHAWIIDLIAPFGGQDGVLRQLKQRLFADRPLKLLQPSKDGKPVAGEVLIKEKDGSKN